MWHENLINKKSFRFSRKFDFNHFIQWSTIILWNDQYWTETKQPWNYRPHNKWSILRCIRDIRYYDVCNIESRSNNFTFSRIFHTSPTPIVSLHFIDFTTQQAILVSNCAKSVCDGRPKRNPRFHSSGRQEGTPQRYHVLGGRLNN